MRVPSANPTPATIAANVRPYQQVLPHIVSQHVEQAAFLWLLRDQAVRDAAYSLKSLVSLDDRVEAHLDALRIAGAAAEEIIADSCMFDQPGDFFVAATLALESTQNERIDEVIKATETRPDLSRGVISALGWVPPARAEPCLRRLLTAESPLARRVGVAGYAIHRIDAGQKLVDALSDGDADVRARTCRALGELGNHNCLALLRRRMGDDDSVCRFWAAWAVALIGGTRDALTMLEEVAQTVGPHQERALRIALPRMPLASAKALRLKLIERAETLRMGVIAAGVIGDAAAIDWLIEQVKTPTFARKAGESIVRITGVDIDGEKLRGEKPEEFESGPTEEPEDEDVAMDPDESLAWMDPKALHSWWRRNDRHFQIGNRLILGKPLEASWLKHILLNGNQAERSAAALELTVSRPGSSLFEIRAPGFRQRQQLKRATI